MCGIIGYLGKEEASPLLLNGLRRLEYRGYDSAGIVTLSSSRSSFNLKKGTGEIDEINDEVDFESLEGKKGLGHCLHPDTLICTSDGSTSKISELDDQKVLSIDFNDQSIKNGRKQLLTRHKAPETLYKVKTPISEFKATGKHKLFVSENGSIKEKMISQLKGNELVAIPRRLPHNPEGSKKFKKVSVDRHCEIDSTLRKKLRELREENDYTRKDVEKETGIARNYLKNIENGKRNSIESNRLEKLEKLYDISMKETMNLVYRNPVFFPSKPNSKLIQILGYHIGDGYFPSNRSIRYKDERKKILEEYKSLFKDVFNLQGNISDREGHYVLRINSKYLIDWIRENIPSLFNKTGEERIPEFVYQGDKDKISFFLRGIFDAEGGVNSVSGQIYLSMVNKDLVKRIQFLLLKLGILSTYSCDEREKWRDAHRIHINDKKSLQKFREKIGFTAQDKSEELTSILEKSKGLNFKFFSCPFKMKSLYYNFLKKTDLAFHGINDSYCTDLRLKKIIKKLGEGYPEIKKLIEGFLNSDIVWSRFEIEEVKSEVEYVYDLEVEQNHNFIGDLVVQHNSRWATHGSVTKENAHPHLCCSGGISIVHNGIIENYEELKKELQNHEFSSETDSEVIAHYFGEELNKGKCPVETMKGFMEKAKGTFAALILDKNTGQIYAMKRGSPLALGIKENGNFIGSDIYAFSKYTNKAIFFEDNEFAIIDGKSYQFYNKKGKKIEKGIKKFDYGNHLEDRGGHEHWMMKEIREQPRCIDRLDKSLEREQSKEMDELIELMKEHNKVIFVAAGTSYHASLMGVYLLQKVGVEAQSLIASEFKNYERVDEDTLVIAVSQSGETMDTIEAIDYSKNKGGTIASIVNVPYSTIQRKSKVSLEILAGQEKCVAATKTFTNQVFMLMKIVEKMGLDLDTGKIGGALQCAMDKNKEKIKNLASKLEGSDDIYIIGRGSNYPIAREIALKLKEISYIHAEGMMAGELKHGTLALIEEGTPVISLIPDGTDQMESNVKEIEARGAFSVRFSPDSDNFDIPEEIDLFPLVATTLGFLLTYYIARKKGLPVDKPRNLAKCVSVN